MSSGAGRTAPGSTASIRTEGRGNAREGYGSLWGPRRRTHSSVAGIEGPRPHLQLSTQAAREDFCGGLMTDSAIPRIRLGISSCLLGEAVRFDAGHARDPFLTDAFGRAAGSRQSRDPAG